MHRILVMTLLLAGCASTTPTPVPDPAPKWNTLDSVGKKEDRLDSRTAAAVAVARTNAETPAIVRSELSVAQAGLPIPDPADLAYALARAAKADPKTYTDSVANSAKAKADIDKMWATLEAEQKANAKAVAKMAEQIDTLKIRVDEAKREGQRNLYAMVAAGMMVLGGFAIAFGRVLIGAGLLISGVCIGAVPYLLDSTWFLLVVGAIFLLTLLTVCWHFVRTPPAPDDDQKKEAT